MNRRSTLLVAACAAAFVAVAATAATYKWKDENGRVVYGDTPPPGVKAERLNVAAPPPENPNAVRDLAAKEAELKKRQQDRVAEQAKVEQAAADQRAVAERCAQARGRMQTLRSGDGLYQYNEKGEKVYFDAPTRERAIAETERLLRELNCGPVAAAPPAATPPTGTSTY